jgi:hypothetical protein
MSPPRSRSRAVLYRSCVARFSCHKSLPAIRKNLPRNMSKKQKAGSSLRSSDEGKEMNRMIIQVDTDRVAYDGRDWTPVAGEHAWAIARMMKSRERMYKRLAAGRPDFAYNVARAAAEDFHGRIVEYQPIPPAKPGVIH